MNRETYNNQALRTLASSGSDNIKNVDLDLLHGAIGVCTESQELLLAVKRTSVDVINFREELGDVLWYLSIFDRKYSCNLNTDFFNTDQFLFSSIENVVDTIIINSGELLNLFKRALFYGNEVPQDEATQLVRSIFYCVIDLADAFNTSVSELRQKNIDKLMVRYPEKFTSERANNRNLEAEKSALKGN